MEGGTGRETQEKEIYVYLKLINIVVQQKSTQHCKAIISQFKITEKKTFKKLISIVGEIINCWRILCQGVR